MAVHPSQAPPAAPAGRSRSVFKGLWLLLLIPSTCQGNTLADSLGTGGGSQAPALQVTFPSRVCSVPQPNRCLMESEGIREPRHGSVLLECHGLPRENCPTSSIHVSTSERTPPCRASLLLGAPAGAAMAPVFCQDQGFPCNAPSSALLSPPAHLLPTLWLCPSPMALL